MIEEGDFTCEKNVLTGKRGNDYTFDISLSINKMISQISYSNYSFEEYVNESNQTRNNKITFHNVMYSTSVTLEVVNAYKIKYVTEDLNIEEYTKQNHTRINTKNDYNTFQKPGFSLLGWENNGEIVSLGSRVSIDKNKDLELHGIYEKNTEKTLFQYEKVDSNRIKINGYLGNESKVIIPDKIDDVNVVSISQNAFNDKHFELVSLPHTINEIKDNAFNNCKIDNLVFFDNLMTVTNESFNNTVVKKVRINASQKPAYMHSFYASYADKYDRLLSLKDKKKIILYAGSSTRFGFDSEQIDISFPEYDVVNMGVFAYTQSYTQLDIIKNLTKKDDVMVITPEFDAIEYQISLKPTIEWSFIALCEANYDILSTLDLSKYSNFFSSFKEYQNNRKDLLRYEYDDSPSFYDEDGNRVTSSYNTYGDYIVYRKNNEKRVNFGIKRAFYNKKYFLEEDINSFNQEMNSLKESGIKVFYDYSPRMDTSISSDSNQTTIKELGEYLEESINVNFISTIDESLMDPLYFHGTDNHLSTEGVKIRTNRVISRLLHRI